MKRKGARLFLCDATCDESPAFRVGFPGALKQVAAPAR
jgi:hypothetical protein